MPFIEGMFFYFQYPEIIILPYICKMSELIKYFQEKVVFLPVVLAIDITILINLFYKLYFLVTYFSLNIIKLIFPLFYIDFL